MKIDGVFAGGGVKAFSFIGALQVMEENGYEFDQVAGTSAGAIIAALIKAGYNSEELLSLLENLDIETFKDERLTFLPFNLTKWFLLYFRLGLYRGEALEKWLKDVLAKKGIRTFADLEKGSLRVVASDLTKGKMIVLPDDLVDYGVDPVKFSVARAVRMSASIPFFFEPVKMYDRNLDRFVCQIVDGGVLSNFPMWIFSEKGTNKNGRPVIGFQLKSEVNGKADTIHIKNAVSLYKALFSTMRTAHDNRYISKDHAKNIVFIPIQNVNATDFNITDSEKNDLITVGREETETFLKKWYETGRGMRVQIK